MSLPHVHAVVRLLEDVSEHGLRCGDEGVVISVWLAPGNFTYEVEVAQPGEEHGLRALLRSTQLLVVEPQPPGSTRQA